MSSSVPCGLQQPCCKDALHVVSSWHWRRRLRKGIRGDVCTASLQETIQRCGALLQMGAHDEASPAHAQLERHMQLLVKVSHTSVSVALLYFEPWQLSTPTLAL